MKLLSQHISAEAVSVLQDMTMGGVETVDLSDAAALDAARTEIHEMYAPLADLIEDPYQVSECTIGGIPAIEIDGPHVDPDGPVLFHIHGGGYCYLQPRSSLGVSVPIAQAAKARMVSIDYRLAPEHPFPEGLEDLYMAYIALLRDGVAPERISVFGESAGAGLALALTLLLKERGNPMPGALGLISPWADISGRGETYKTLDGIDPAIKWAGDLDTQGLAYMANTSPDNPLLSPVLANLSGLPPMLIQVGTNEVLLSDAATIARNARKAGLAVDLDVWEGMWHVWHVFQNVPEAREATHEMGAFLARNPK